MGKHAGGPTPVNFFSKVNMFFIKVSQHLREFILSISNLYELASLADVDLFPMMLTKINQP